MKLKRVVVLVVAVVAVAAAGVAWASCATPLPKGEPGPAADDLAHSIAAFVGKPAWDATGAISFTFRGARSFVWDRERSFLYAKKGDDEMWLDLVDKGGTAKKAGADVDEATRTKMLADAWSWFCNDTFWLNPLVKLFDEGTTRSLVSDDGKGRRGVMVTYGAGGVTPGDSYLWLVDDKGAPVAVRMWVQILPVKGAEFTWEKWATLSTGARVATLHKGVMGLELTLDDPKGARTLAELEPGQPDRFAALVARRGTAPSSQPAAPEPAAASQPAGP